MSLRDDIAKNMTAAMKAREKLKLSTLRLLLNAVKYKEVELKKELDDAGVLQIVATLIRQREDSVEQYRAGGRDELADKEASEIEILRAYQPPQLSADELRLIVKKHAAECEAAGMKDMGKVMKAVMGTVKGRAKGKAVNEMVKEVLGALEG